MKSDPWKFQSTWKSEDWFNNATLASFLASTGTLYISGIVLDNPTTYFKLDTATGLIQLWSGETLIAQWESVTPIPPGSLEGQLMGVLCLTYAS